MFASLIVSAFSFASIVLAGPIDLTIRVIRTTCVPSVAGKEFMIALSSNHTLQWTLNDCIEPQCTSVSLNAPNPVNSQWRSWYASGKGGSAPPFNISTAVNPYGFCIAAPSYGSHLSGRDCIAGEVTQEFKFECAQCSSASTVFGTGCQVESWDWGQCAQENGEGEVIQLAGCSKGEASQTFDLILT